MAKVYRNPVLRNADGKPAYCLDYFDVDGRRRRERTNAATKEEAERLLRSRLGEIDRARIVGVSSVERLRGIVLSAFVKDVYRPFIKTAKSAASVDRDEQAFKKLLPAFGAVKLADVKPGKIQDYAEKRIRDGARPATVNRELFVLSAVFREAFKRELVDVNPVHRVRKYRVNDGVLRYLSAEEEVFLLSAAPAFLRPIITLAIHTGCRKGELLALTWADVDKEQRLLRVQASKTGKTRYIPLNDVAMATLDGLDRNVVSLFLFWNPETGTRWYDLKPVWYRDVAPKLAKKGIPHLRFHDLRHTFASRLVQGGVPLNTVRELLGHGSMAMTLRYAHLAPDNLREAVRVLTSAAGSGPGVAKSMANAATA